MKKIAERIWNEPAVAIGLLATLALLVINLIGGEDWAVETFVEVLTPLAAALGIRQFVRPDRGPDQAEAGSGSRATSTLEPL
jgi:hypothetical protein